MNDRENPGNNNNDDELEAPVKEYTGRGAGYYPSMDRQRAGAMEVFVEHNIEKAMKILKRKLIKEGLFKELKSRRYYEKPSEKKKRKQKESIKKLRKEEARSRKNPYF